MGSAEGVAKGAAAHLGLTLDEYKGRLASGQKWCVACKKWQPRSDFSVDRSRGDGLFTACRTSRSTHTAPGPSFPERRRMAASGSAWCRTCKAWLPIGDVVGGACRPHINSEARVFYRRRAAEVIARKSARRRGLAPIPTWWSTEHAEVFGGLCAYGCGRSYYGFDHVWPVAKGGKSVPANLVPACASCNSSKGDRNPVPWVIRGMRAFPWQWLDLEILAIEQGTDEWREGLDLIPDSYWANEFHALRTAV